MGLRGQAGLLGGGLLGGLALLQRTGGELSVLLGLRGGRVGERLRPGLRVGRGLLGLLRELRVPRGGLLGERAGPGLLQGGALQRAALLLGGGHEGGVLLCRSGGGIEDLAGAVLRPRALQERLLGQCGLLRGGLVGEPAGLGVLGGGLLGGPALFQRRRGEGGVVLGLPARVHGGVTGPLLGQGGGLVGGPSGLGVPLRALLRLFASPSLVERLGLRALPLLSASVTKSAYSSAFSVAESATSRARSSACARSRNACSASAACWAAASSAARRASAATAAAFSAARRSSRATRANAACSSACWAARSAAWRARSSASAARACASWACWACRAVSSSASRRAGAARGGPLQLLALLLGLADQGGVLVGGLRGLLGQRQRPLFGGGPLGQRLLGDLGVVAGGALRVGPGLCASSASSAALRAASSAASRSVS